LLSRRDDRRSATAILKPQHGLSYCIPAPHRHGPPRAGGAGGILTEPKSPPGSPPRRGHPLWRAFKIVAGVAFTGLGVVGLFLPFLQGVLFMLIGLALLSSESRRLRALLDRLRRRFPEAHALERRLIDRFWQKLGRGRGGGDSSDPGRDDQAP
jgi:hypothetical protein